VTRRRFFRRLASHDANGINHNADKRADLARPLWVRESRLFGLRRAIVQSFGKGRSCSREGLIVKRQVNKLSLAQAAALLVRHGARGSLTKRWVTRANRARAR
jgi:hypothetical protein